MMHGIRRLRLLEVGLLGLCLVVGETIAAPYDDGQLEYPLKNLCRRWDHQSIVANNKLYLLGGRVLVEESLPKTSKTSWVWDGEPSSEFLELDLSQSFSLEKGENNNLPQWKPVDYSIGDAKYEEPLAVAGGGMWGNDKKLYVYEGQHTKNATEEDESTLWSYDIADKHWRLEKNWEQGDKRLPNRFTRGTSVNVPGKGMGFYVGGARLYQDDQKNKEWTYPLNQQFIGMDIGAENYATDFKGLSRGRKTIGAAATWIPVGEKGSLVMIGGTDEEEDRGFSTYNGVKNPDTAPASSAMARKEEVWIYDIAGDKWHIQESSGKIPWERMHACAVSASAPDNSSHQIFYYGGGAGSRFFGMDDTVYMGDLYVLNLPSFEWMQFVDLENPPAPRTRHTCHVVNNRQMMIVGGSRNDTGTDLAKSCTWDEISVLDMTTLTWETEYTPATEPYSVNEGILTNSQYAGKGKTAPALGWVSDELESLFAGKEEGKKTVGPEKLVADEKIIGLEKKAFIGAVAGAGVGLLVLAIIACCCCQRRSNRKFQKERLEKVHEPYRHKVSTSIPDNSPAPQYQPYQSYQPYGQVSPYIPTPTGSEFAAVPKTRLKNPTPPPVEMSAEPMYPSEMAAEPMIYELPTIIESPTSPSNIYGDYDPSAQQSERRPRSPSQSYSRNSSRDVSPMSPRFDVSARLGSRDDLVPVVL